MIKDPSNWIKASASDGATNCVEMRCNEGAVEVRDTKQRGQGPSLHLSPEAFAAWVDAAKRGDLDNIG